MTIIEINNAISTLQTFLNTESFEGELHIHQIEVSKKKDTILIDVEFDRNNLLDFLQLRTIDKQNYEVWGYRNDEPESVNPKLEKLF